MPLKLSDLGSFQFNLKIPYQGVNPFSTPTFSWPNIDEPLEAGVQRSGHTVLNGRGLIQSERPEV